MASYHQRSRTKIVGRDTESQSSDEISETRPASRAAKAVHLDQLSVHFDQEKDIRDRCGTLFSRLFGCSKLFSKIVILIKDNMV